MKRSTNHTLRSLVESLGAHRLVHTFSAPSDVEIAAVFDDSRQVTPGSLFVAVQGTETDGHAFIPAAIEKGAACIVAEKAFDADSDIPVIRVIDGRRALAVLSHTVAGWPSEKLRVVGVTGTNGKTTTAWLIHHMLTRVGCETGLLGTIESRIGARKVVASMTTPGPVEVSAALSEMVEAGCTDCVMEVSSHALAQHRVYGIRFSAAVFTNLTRDHLDYHGTWDAYLGAKKSLFDGLDSGAAAVFNVDDVSGSEIVADSAAVRHGYGRRDAADHRFEVLDSSLSGLRLSIDGETRSFDLVGGFNAYNVTAAYSVGRAFGLTRSDALDAMESARPVPGRLEQISFPSGVTAIVDYAHTPDALKNVLETVRDLANPTSGLWCIFGCGGDRDRGKRPLMGAIAERLADHVVVTSDNPRTEDPEEILEDIRGGMRQPEHAEWIADRREAIRFVGQNAAAGDTVVVAGKGHETYQVVGRERVHLDDREEVRKWFS